MLKYAVIFIVISCLKAAPSDGEGRWIFDIVEKFQEEIAQVDLSIEALANKTVETEDEISASMLRLSLIRKESENLLDFLKVIVKNTTAEAIDENIDVNSCLEEETQLGNALEANVYSQIDDINMKFMPEYERLMGVTTNLNNILPTLTKNLNGLIKNCMIHNFFPWQIDELAECITKGIDETKFEISRIEFGIVAVNDQNEELFGDMEKSIADLLQNIVEGMIGIVERLKQCTASIEVTTEKPSTSEIS